MRTLLILLHDSHKNLNLRLKLTRLVRLLLGCCCFRWLVHWTVRWTHGVNSSSQLLSMFLHFRSQVVLLSLRSDGGFMVFSSSSCREILPYRENFVPYVHYFAEFLATTLTQGSLWVCRSLLKLLLLSGLFLSIEIINRFPFSTQKISTNFRLIKKS